MSRFTRLAATFALVGVGSAGVVAVALPGPDAKTAAATPAISTPAASPSATVSETPSTITREKRVSRSEVRSAPSAPAKKKPSASSTRKTELKGTARTKVATPAPALKVTGTRYTTANVKIRVEPKAKSKAVTVVKPGTRLKVTSSVRNGFRYVSYNSRGRWVTNAYLSKTKPKPVVRKVAARKAASKSSSGSGSSGGVTMARCSKGSSMESGLTRDAILVHRTLCARYPQVSSFGGNRNASGFHGTGQAVDCMISNSSVGWAMARWVRAHAKQLGVSEVIYAQKIWTVRRSSEGWRPMSDRGSATANHYDHVHVSVYGNSATG